MPCSIRRVNTTFCGTRSAPSWRRIWIATSTGDLIEAHKALSWGLVNRVVPADQLDAAVADLAKQIAAKPRQTVADGKRAFYQQLELGLEGAYELASQVNACSFDSEEGKEGMNAFLEKRSPKWNQWVQKDRAKVQSKSEQLRK